jgi:hypothetical protein
MVIIDDKKAPNGIEAFQELLVAEGRLCPD